jgi:hypothetical protein
LRALLSSIGNSGPREWLRSSGSGEELVKVVGIEAFDHFGAGGGENHQGGGLWLLRFGRADQRYDLAILKIG